MTRKEIAKDFFSKVVLLVFLAWFLFAMFKNVFVKDGITDYFKVWIVCGIPFGIWRLRVWMLWGEVKDFIHAIRRMPQKLLSIIHEHLPKTQNQESSR